jgi:uncharacterized protein (TIRG00374 family)
MLTKKHQRALSLSILIAVGIYAFFIFTADTKQILLTMRQLSVTDWLIILSCTFSSYIFRFIRWNKYISAFNHHIPLTRHFAYYLAGLALTTTPAKAGETVRTVYLLPYKVKFNQSLACFFTERLLDVTVMVCLASFIFFTFPDLDKSYAYFILTLAIATVIILPLLSTQIPQDVLHFIISKFSAHKLSRALQHLITLLQSAHRILEIKLLSQGLLLGLIAWILNGIGFYLILSITGFPLDFTVALTIYAISILAGAASFIPGGIGATEAVMGLMLLSLGSEQHIAIAVPILTRLSTLWFAVCVGLLANAYLSINTPQHN